MKRYLLLFAICISTLSISAQCDFPNPGFEDWSDQTMTFDDQMLLAPGTIPLPDEHISLFRFLTTFFIINFLDPNDPDYEDLYMEAYSHGFGVFESADAHSGDAALRIGGDEVVTGADLYTVFPCSEVPESITFSYKHVGEGADTLNIYGFTILGLGGAPQDSADLLTIPGYIDHYIYVDSTQMEYTTVTIPYNVNNDDPRDTLVHYFIVTGNEDFYATGEESYFLIDDVSYNLPGQLVDADMDGYDESVDCDETDPNINPGAMEIPNNDVDEDCDGIVLVIDEDMDGFNSDDDCDDTNAAINPDAMEIPNNDVDEDCDGEVLVIDEDMDGFNSDDDCDDTDAAINPDAMEIPNNDVDEDCDGEVLVIDEDMDGYNSDDDCDDTNAAINPDAMEIPNNDVDEDCDGVAQMIDDDMDGFNSDEDCDDTNAAINPDAMEIPNNDVDEDCDGVAQMIDEDMDGYNSDDDCDDTNPAINPGAVEIPNNDVDENCDGIIVPNAEIELFEVAVYPNPVSNLLIIEVERNVTFSMFNNAGQKVQMDQAINNRKVIATSDLSAGSYLIHLIDKEGNRVIRRIVKF